MVTSSFLQGLDTREKVSRFINRIIALVLRLENHFLGEKTIPGKKVNETIQEIAWIQDFLYKNGYDERLDNPNS